eukprot:gnl/MRDRNA2_/MRDRNA2_33106_c0_seq1.p1 gnl/MRDRNA2_/MRDRNA2_33106_c0~~gnl/MRDRNA2_/MRDRNA2_33106_c0_seq1.p1  ORF type:complete len:855 (+),score=114.71 gnl/MRDRNA2_/MRDRNA2_33106_c0_seq1:99-2663(+)
MSTLLLSTKRVCAMIFYLTSAKNVGSSSQIAGHESLDLAPFIIIPPVLGSTLVANLNGRKSVSPRCGTEGTKTLWFDMTAFLTPDCWQQEMDLDVNIEASEKLGKEVDIEPEGVQVTTVGYGDPDESLVKFPMINHGAGPFAKVIAALEKLGYQKNWNLFAAPFDWRRGPSYWLEHDWKVLKEFIEKVVEGAGGKPAIFTSVSMGGSYFIAFLLHGEGVDADWKKKHIAGFGMMSGPLAGTAAALGTVVWGHPVPPKAKANLHKMPDYVQDAEKLLSFVHLDKLTRGWGSIAWLMPMQSEKHRDYVFLELPKEWGGNVTGAMLPDLLFHLSGKTGELYKLAQKFPISAHPGVPVLCMFGSGKSSIGGYRYSLNATLDNGEHKSPSNLLGQVMDLASNEDKTKNLDGLIGQFADIVQDNGVVDVNRPSGASKVGDKSWIVAVAELLRQRQPDHVKLTPGDGFVAAESLAACETWTQEPKVDVHRDQSTSHGEEVISDQHIAQLLTFVTKVSQTAHQSTVTGTAPESPKVALQNTKSTSKCTLWEGVTRPPYTPACSPCYQAAPCFGLVQGSDGYPVERGAADLVTNKKGKGKGKWKCGCYKRGEDPGVTCSGKWSLCLKARACLKCFGLEPNTFPASVLPPDKVDAGATTSETSYVSQSTTQSPSSPAGSSFTRPTRSFGPFGGLGGGLGPRLKTGGKGPLTGPLGRLAGLGVKARPAQQNVGGIHTASTATPAPTSASTKPHSKKESMLEEMPSDPSNVSSYIAVLNSFAGIFIPIFCLVGLVSCGVFCVCARHRQRELARLGTPADILLEDRENAPLDMEQEPSWQSQTQSTSGFSHGGDEASYEMLATPRGS